METASGSVYKLEGHMECLDAMHAGKLAGGEVSESVAISI